MNYIGHYCKVDVLKSALWKNFCTDRVIVGNDPVNNLDPFGLFGDGLTIWLEIEKEDKQNNYQKTNYTDNWDICNTFPHNTICDVNSGPCIVKQPGENVDVSDKLTNNNQERKGFVQSEENAWLSISSSPILISNDCNVDVFNSCMNGILTEDSYSGGSETYNLKTNNCIDYKKKTVKSCRREACQ